MKKFLEAVAVVALTLFMVAMFTMLVIEWAAGCGETYVDAYGKRHAYECVFIEEWRNAK